jgi:hypothetical protein
MKRIISIALGLALLCSTFGFADSSLADLQGAVDGFSEELTKSLPFNASVGLNWADAYIGQLFDIPPHFGFGIAGGVTTLNSKAFKGLMSKFALDLPIDQMMLPAYTVEGRIGGFVLPFDIGVKFGALPAVSFGDTLKIDYLLAGADIRYAIVKGNVIIPKVSIGLGVNYLQSSLTAPIGSSVSFDVGGKTLALTQPEATFSWKTTSLELKVQVSKSIVIITPYLGVGASYAWSEAGYSIDSELQYDGSAIDDTDIGIIKDYLEVNGATGLDDLSGSGFSSILKSSGFGLRAFGGLSFNLAVVKIDLTGMYNFLDNNYGATLGVRLQF